MQLPVSFVSKIERLLGAESTALVSALSGSSPVSVRQNPHKSTTNFNQFERVPWCSTGYYLPERPVFTLDPLFHAGSYYVQEASSMFIEQWWNNFVPQNTPLRVLDLCAAPGGKSTHLLSLMNSESVLVCNEPVPTRNKILQHNLAKWGHSNFIITQNEPHQFEPLGEYFDVILVDAPCSGEGMFRKDKNAIAEWSEEIVQQCAIRQTSILQSTAKVLKPGGILVYSTCTFDERENEEQVKQLISEGFELCSLPNTDIRIANTDYGYRFYPHKTKGEGFFTSCLQKRDKYSSTKIQSTNNGNPNSTTEKYLKEPHLFKYISRSEKHFAIPLAHEHTYKTLSSTVNVRAAGIYLGDTKNNDFLPSQQLSWSNHLRNDLPFVEINNEQAVKYLRGETFPLTTGLRGWHLVRYQNFALGWIKAIDHRFNNHYPKEWRILMR